MKVQRLESNLCCISNANISYTVGLVTGMAKNEEYCGIIIQTYITIDVHWLPWAAVLPVFDQAQSSLECLWLFHALCHWLWAQWMPPTPAPAAEHSQLLHATAHTDYCNCHYIIHCITVDPWSGCWAGTLTYSITGAVNGGW